MQEWEGEVQDSVVSWASGDEEMLGDTSSELCIGTWYWCGSFHLVVLTVSLVGSSMEEGDWGWTVWGFSHRKCCFANLEDIFNYLGQKHLFGKNVGFRRFQISNVTPLEAIRLEKIRISLFRSGL